MIERAQEQEQRQAQYLALGVFHGAAPLLSGKPEGLKQYLREINRR